VEESKVVLSVKRSFPVAEPGRLFGTMSRCAGRDCSFLEETSRLLPFDRGALAIELDENWNGRQ